MAILNEKQRFLPQLIAVLALAVLVCAPVLAGTDSNAPGVSGVPLVTGTGACTGDCSGGDTGNAIEGAALNVAYATKLNGGYVARGVGMRNRGYGSIYINQIPLNSTVAKAFLFWAVLTPDTVNPNPPAPPLARYTKGAINGNAITGTLLGNAENPCWSNYSGNGRIFTYRADVTAFVKGNGTYHLTGFASGRTDGDDPWSGAPQKWPLVEGASLVVVYANAQYPSTKIIVMNGDVTVKSNSATTTVSGIPPYAKPVAYTTWIVADGQSNGGKSVTFNGETMPSTYLNGNDPMNGTKKYAYGNLWDTQNALVNLTPGASTVPTTITSTGDCVTWVAQVLSAWDGNTDTDGDALKDYWEVYGYDHDNDKKVDVNLPKLGATPFHKDLFIEVNYMPGHKPNATVLSRAVATFKNAPYANNPDQKPGILLHNLVSKQVAHDDDLNPVWTQFNAIKAANFPANHSAIYHYCLFAHGIMGTSTSGISNGIPASDFIVSLGKWGANDNDNAKTGTYIHEFGHNLGLRHGGTDDVNYKPNYLSIMNYHFQISGLYRGGSWGNYDYQRIQPFTLNEANLLEANGVGASAAGYRTMWYCPGGAVRTSTSNKPINWSCNATVDAFPVRVDLNKDGARTVLTSQLNWKNITYKGGSVGTGVSPGTENQIVTADQMEELTYEEYLRYEAETGKRV